MGTHNHHITTQYHLIYTFFPTTDTMSRNSTLERAVIIVYHVLGFVQVIVAGSDHRGDIHEIEADIESPSDVASVSKFIKEFHVSFPKQQYNITIKIFCTYFITSPITVVLVLHYLLIFVFVEDATILKKVKKRCQWFHS